MWKLKDLEESLLIGSTLVEGSTLTEGEAREVLAGKTVQGHPISEMREVLNYRQGTSWLLKEVSEVPYLSQDLILGFHRILFQGISDQAGKWKTAQNYTYLSSGEKYRYAPPSEVDSGIQSWIESFNGAELGKKVNPKKVAEEGARLYYHFEHLHPFEDGNGRIGRIFIAYWFYWKAGLEFRFYLKDKIDHLKALEAANKGEFSLLNQFFEERIRKE